jgi:chromosome segregation ATPase
MFFTKKAVPATSKISKTEPDSARSGSPVDSVISKAPSLAPPQAPRARYFSKWTKRPAPVYSVVSTTVKSSPVDSVIKDLASKNAQLQDDNNQMKEVGLLNRAMLQKLANDFEDEEQQCTGLRGALRILDLELKQANKSPPSDSGEERIQELNRILSENEQEAKSLEDELQATQDQHKAADNFSARNTAMLVNSLAQERSRTAELQHTITERDEQLSELEISLEGMQSSHANLYNERTQLSQALTLARQANSSLQRGNDELAARAAAAETTNANINALIPALKTQVEDLMASVAAQTAKHKAQVDAMYAQHAQTRDQLEARLAAKNTAIRELQVQVDLADAEAGKDVAAHDEQIAQLQDQLARLTLSNEDEEAQKAAWHDYADEQRTRGDCFQAQIDAWRDWANQQQNQGDHFEAQANAWREDSDQQRMRADDLEDELFAIEEDANEEPELRELNEGNHVNADLAN